MRWVSHMSKRSPKHPVYGPPEVIKGNGVKYWAEHYGSPRRYDAADGSKILTQKTTYFLSINLSSRCRQLTDLPSQQSNALLSPYPIPQNKLWLTQKWHAESNDAKVLVWTWTKFSYIDLTSRNQYMTCFGHVPGQRRPYYRLISDILCLIKTKHAEDHKVKILARTGTYFSNIDLTSRHHYVK